MQWLWSDRYLVIYCSDRQQGAAISPPAISFNVNCLDDLEKFDQSESWHDSGEFIAEVKQRIASGEVVITATLGDRLAYYCWLVPAQTSGYFPFVDRDYVYPAGSAVMYNSYCHPAARGAGLHQAGLKFLIKWALSHSATNYVYGAIDINNRTSRYCSEKIGRLPYEVLFRKCRFGRVTKGTLPPSFVAEYEEKKLRRA